MTPYQPEELIRKYLNNACTEEEKALVESWHLQDLAESPYIPDQERIQTVHDQMREALATHIKTSRRAARIRRIGLRAAAAVLLLALLGTAGYWLQARRHPSAAGKQQPALAQAADIAPGHDGAVLTLEDGTKMILDSMGNGPVTIRKGSNAVLNSGELTYEAGTGTSTEPAFNRISTSRGRQFRVQLPDGTRVWLNAASSLRYPVRFTGGERRVELTGEAFFEVARNTTAPFRVRINPTTSIEVLGTEFNINAYSDEASINTTLLNGKVRVVEEGNGKRQTVELKPGQQAQIVTTPGQETAQVQPGIPIRVLSQVDMARVMAWKNGVFNFQDASLGEVMRQLARWYDIEVDYEQGIPKIEFEGSVNRGNSLSVVLRSLEVSGVHFRLGEGRKLTVLP